MTDRVGPGRPPVSGRFRKGESGNPKGRPPSKPTQAASAFDIVMDRTLDVTQGGRTRELTIEEALQLKTYQAAAAGNRAAQREVLKWIEKREAWRIAHAPKPPPPKLAFVHDPMNANEALLLLGLAAYDPTLKAEGHDRLRLQPWAVQAALSRPGRPRLSAEEIATVKRCTQDPQTLSWPAGSRDDPDL